MSESTDEPERRDGAGGEKPADASRDERGANPEPHEQAGPGETPESGRPAGSAKPQAGGGDDEAADAHAGSEAPTPPEAAKPQAPGGQDKPAPEGSTAPSGAQAGPGTGERRGRAGGQGDMSAFEADVGADSDLAKAMDRIGKLSDQLDHVNDDLAHARADYYNLERQYGAFVRRTKEEAASSRQAGRLDVLQALISVLDDIDAARTHGELASGPFASIARKLESTLATHFHLERFGEEGEDFDPKRHEALLAETKPDVDHPVVGQVLQPGYKVGERILRATKVKVHNPK